VKKLLFLFIFFLFIQCQQSKIETVHSTWSEERISDWYAKQPWLVGSNFITSSSINQLEFWQEETFDQELIDKELKLSASIGMNTHRVFLHDLLWQQDSIGFMLRIDKFLEISERYGIKTLLVFFDDVWHPVPKLGKQPEPLPHVHNSGWVQSPGAKILYDTLSHNSLKPYVKGIVSKFANDARVLAWDLYNEPGQKGISSHNISKERAIELYSNVGIEITDENYSTYDLSQIDPKDKKQTYTLSLLKKTVQWVREVNPSQPLTIGIYEWNVDWGVFNDLSDLNSITRILSLFIHIPPKMKSQEKSKNLKITIDPYYVQNMLLVNTRIPLRRYYLYLKKIKLQPTIGGLFLGRPIPFIHGKVGTQLIPAHQINGITIFSIKMDCHFRLKKSSL
jgi:hypothetical protein